MERSGGVERNGAARYGEVSLRRLHVVVGAANA